MTDPIFIEAEKQRIEQVLNNFLDNALKFTSSGTITIARKLRVSPEIHVCDFVEHYKLPTVVTAKTMKIF
jgi:signal transduction histidine kinase